MLGNSAFTEMMFTDLIPMIEKTYRALPGAASRAMAGLSMGGNMTFRVTVPNLDKFAYIGSFSGTMNGLSTDALQALQTGGQVREHVGDHPWVELGGIEGR